MRYFISIIILNIFIALGGQAIVKKENDFKKESKFSIDSTRQALAIDTSWANFWKVFSNAMNAKDKNTIANLTSKDFYDGGGGTVEEWLDAEVFFNQEHFHSYQGVIKKGAQSFRNEGRQYKATGTNHSGDLFFEYKNGKWLFGGIVGD